MIAIWRDGPNDATPFPTPSKVEGSHHWSYERLLSAALVPLTASAVAVSGSAHPIVDGMLGVALVVHSHIGFDAVLVDYLHERKFPVIGQVAKWGLRFATGGALVGVYSFNTQDIGLTEFVKGVWTA
ncbi:CybS-domain-containing protein [Cantharellus anzutake]|uniref:CybS-domain-containing protein n=1 Tax=Cantharellus anzutake TaxID=1750568 RepID=UPI0019083A8B|nr:CybS-domain-containing protein [Cantharellus anzutake]KAF8333459.1 CybS-domain-containing protein [Cantharellus anzutake]